MDRRKMLTLLGTVGTAGCLRFQEAGTAQTRTADDSIAERTTNSPTEETGSVEETEDTAGKSGGGEDKITEVTLSERWTTGRNLSIAWARNYWFFFSGFEGVAAAHASGMRWSRDINGGAYNLGTRAFASNGSTVVFGITPDADHEEVSDDAGASFHAFDYNSGDELWTVKAPSNGKHQFAQGVAIVGDIAVVGSHHFADGEPLVYGIDIASGDKLWETGVPNLPTTRLSDIFAYNNEPYVILGGKGTWVLDPQTGSIIDTHESMKAPWPGGTVFANDLFVTYRGLTAHDLENGGERWSKSANEFQSTPPAVDNSLVVAGTESGGIIAFERATGEKLWESNIGQGVQTLELSVSLVWVVAGESGLLALRRNDGEVVYRATHDIDNIALYENTLLVGGSDTAAYLVDTN